jgi:hypothetical protein
MEFGGAHRNAKRVRLRHSRVTRAAASVVTTLTVANRATLLSGEWPGARHSGVQRLAMLTVLRRLISALDIAAGIGA